MGIQSQKLHEIKGKKFLNASLTPSHPDDDEVTQGSTARTTICAKLRRNICIFDTGRERKTR